MLCHRENARSQAILAALSNGTAELTSKDASRTKPSHQELAQGTDDMYDNVIVHEETQDKFDTARTVDHVMTAPISLDAHAAFMHLFKGARSTQSANFCALRSTDERSTDTGSPLQYMARRDILFRTSQSGMETTLDDHIQQVVYYISASPRMNLLLAGTEFQSDAKGILKSIYTGEWCVVGWLASGTSTSKACVTKFLSPGETQTNATHIVLATGRLITLLGYIYGAEAYLPWQLQWQYYLPMTVSLPHIHPMSMLQFANGHIAEWMSPTTTTNIRSWVERRGTLASYIKEHMRITPTMIATLQESSSMRVQGEYLARLASPDLVKVISTPQLTPQGVANGKGSKKKQAKKPMSGLKGYCMTWLQSNKMPCSNPLCVANAVKSRFRHRTEFDAETQQVRSDIVKEAKKLAPAGVTIQVHA